MRDFVESLDHPLLFVVFLGLALYGLTNIAKWGASKWGIFGLKAFLPQ